MVGADDDGGLVPPGLLRRPREQLADVKIGVVDLVVVEIALAAAEVRRLGVFDPLVVGIGVVGPGEELTLHVLGIGEVLHHQLMGLRARDVIVAAFVEGDARDHVPDVEALVEPLAAIEVEVRVHANGADILGGEGFGEELVGVLIAGEEVAAPIQRGGGAPREHRGNALGGEARHRAMRVEHHVLLREARQVRRDVTGVARPGHVGAQGVDGEQEHVQRFAFARALVLQGGSCLGDRCRRGGLGPGRLGGLCWLLVWRGIAATTKHEQGQGQEQRAVQLHASVLARGPRSGQLPDISARASGDRA